MLNMAIPWWELILRSAVVYAGKFQHGAILAQGFSNALVTVLVLQFHATDVGRNVDVISHEDHERHAQAQADERTPRRKHRAGGESRGNVRDGVERHQCHGPRP